MDRPVKYLQTDSRWGALDYSARGEKTTIAKSGCGPTCAAMVIASLKDITVTPKETVTWSKKHGYKAKNQGTYYTYFIPQLAEYGIECHRVNLSNTYGKTDASTNSIHAEVEQALKTGKWVIACMGKGTWTSSGHFVLAYKVKDGRVYINDPASEKAMRECNSLSLWQSQVKYYWIVETSISTATTAPPQGEGDDEVVTDRNINIFGREYTTKGIFKEGSNYLSPKVLTDAGFTVTSEGSKPIISMPNIKVRYNSKSAEIRGFKSNGTNYCGIRDVLELLGYTVDWQNGEVVITEVSTIKEEY